MTNYFFSISNFLIAIVILLTGSSCQKVNLDEIENLNGNRITLIGHGGMGFTSPENDLPHNSFRSLTKAVEAYGVEGVEVDIQLSADSVIVMYHDDLLESGTNCSGCIYFEESEKLMDCRFRSIIRKHLFLDEKLKTLDALLERFAQRPIKPIVVFDVKLVQEACGLGDITVYKNQFIDEIIRLVSKHDAADWCIVGSGDLGFLVKIKEALPNIRLAYNLSWFTEEEIVEAAAKGVFMVTSFDDSMTKGYIKLIHDHGLRVALYGVIVRDDAVEAINKSPDYIYGDNIVLLQEILR